MKKERIYFAFQVDENTAAFDKAIQQMRTKHRDTVKNDPAYKKLMDERAAAYRAQQAYLLAKDEKLADLKRQLGAEQK